jgi:hypothetical protein
VEELELRASITTLASPSKSTKFKLSLATIETAKRVVFTLAQVGDQGHGKQSRH